MALFLIRRNVPGATQEDMDAAAFRAITCAFHFTDMRWHHSFWDKEAGILHCLYEAATVGDVYTHAERARIPCDEVYEVSRLGPDIYTGQPASNLASV